jgi:GH24 family phage-related lysozyme (muramidase)
VTGLGRVSNDPAERGQARRLAFLIELFRESSSPYINRFLSADTIVPGYANPQNLNRYSYVKNNPLRYIDPSGHKPACGEYGEECGEDELNALIGGGGNHVENMETSEEGEDFIKYWEDDDYANYPYPDGGGNCTIGWGHFLKKNGCSGWPNKTWYYDKENPHPLSSMEAENFFQDDITNAENIIQDTVTADLTQAQFDALVSYIFNVGGDKFKDKGIPKLINSGDYEGAASAIASGPITSGEPPVTFDKLKERRQAEAALFLNGTYVP